MALSGRQISPSSRANLGLTLALIPLVWVAALVMGIVETKRQKWLKRLRLYRLLSFAAWGVHSLVFVLFFHGLA